jgi:hypothetical protein
MAFTATHQRSGAGTVSTSTVTLYTGGTDGPNNICGFELRCLSGIARFFLDDACHSASGVVLSAASTAGNNVWSPLCLSGRNFQSLTCKSATAAMIAWRPSAVR